MRRQRPIYGVIITGCILLFSIFLLLSVFGPPVVPDEGPPTVYLLYASAGTMPQLLITDQIDAFITWEPVVSNAELSGIGTIIATPADLPPPGKWENAAINVLVLRKDLIEQYPDISALLSALTTAAINRTNEDPEPAREITADWVFGTAPILTPVGSIDPLDVENSSFGYMNFTADAEIPESGIVNQVVNGDTNSTYNPEDMVNPVVSMRGNQFLNGSAIPRLTGDIPTINIGYIPSSDNYAPLYVMVKESGYFCDQYGFCLAPDDPEASRPVECTLFVQGAPAAHINLIPGQSGGGIMTTIGQKSLQGAYVGAVPAELQIALGNPSSIIQSINTGGSGLVVSNEVDCKNWDSFVAWVKLFHKADKPPLVIATVQSSIQEDMIREALAYENISVILYGTDFETEYP